MVVRVATGKPWRIGSLHPTRLTRCSSYSVLVLRAMVWSALTRIQYKRRMRAENLQPVILVCLQCRENNNVDVDQFNMAFIYPLLFAATTGVPCLAPQGQSPYTDRRRRQNDHH